MLIEQLDDIDEARELHDLAFPSDKWVGDNHTFWVARDGRGLTGFCSAIHYPDKNTVFLSRCAVVERAQGKNLQRELIKARVRWAERGCASAVITYTKLQNYASMVNLLDCGFRFYKPETKWAGTQRVHYFKKLLR